MNLNKTSAFVLSLDFELFWGVYESRGAEYYPAIERVFTVVPRLLDLFQRYEISCTWATVGAILLEDAEVFETHKPSRLPCYKNIALSPYKDVNNLALLNKNLLFAPNLVGEICRTPGQEVGSHTFSHYYALEDGQSIEDFNADLEANLAAAAIYGLKLSSFVFPRNQFNQEYLEACSVAGFTAYRGNPDHWAYAAAAKDKFDIHKRFFRLVDAYIPVSGSMTHSLKLARDNNIYNVPASLFFRPFNRKLKILESLKLKRIKYAMRCAAKEGRLFHLWWHPHNFSSNTEENFFQIEEIIKYFKLLKSEYGMRSMSMGDIASAQEEHHA